MWNYDYDYEHVSSVKNDDNDTPCVKVMSKIRPWMNIDRSKHTNILQVSLLKISCIITRQIICSFFFLLHKIEEMRESKYC